MSSYGDCKDCARPMRGSRQKTADYPGTVSYSSNGYCQGCIRRRRRTGAAPIVQGSQRPHIDVTATMRSLMAYHQWRKPFRVKAGQS